jgi:hypothetical protein
MKFKEQHLKSLFQEIVIEVAGGYPFLRLSPTFQF